MDLMPIRKLIIDQGIVSVPVFVHELPATVEQGVMLRGRPTGARVDPYLPGYFHSGFQTLVRHPQHQPAYIIARRLYDDLWSELEIELPEYTILYMRPKHLPITFPRSQGHEIEVSVNFDIGFRE